MSNNYYPPYAPPSYAERLARAQRSLGVNPSKGEHDLLRHMLNTADAAERLAVAFTERQKPTGEDDATAVSLLRMADQIRDCTYLVARGER